jgi:hypothetical protein
VEGAKGLTKSSTSVLDRSPEGRKEPDPMARDPEWPELPLIILVIVTVSLIILWFA